MALYGPSVKPKPLYQQRFIRHSPSSPRRYTDTITGEVIKRAERDKRARAEGLQRVISESEREKRRATKLRTTHLARSFAHYNNLSISDAQKSPEFKKLREELKKNPSDAKKKQLLKDAGFRKGVPSYVPVGQSKDYRIATSKPGLTYEQKRTLYRAYVRQSKE
jgi:hypothetical protein